MTFADELKDWRADRGYTAREAAALLGVKPRTYEDWEYGRHEPSQTEPLRKLMRMSKKRLIHES